jgi:drug/metabolite transporter (DMT)-like permease
VVGFVGAVLLLAPWRAAPAGTFGGSAACLIASAAYGMSFVYMGRRLVGRGMPPLVLAAGQLIAATAWALLALPFVGRSTVHPHAEVLGAVVALGLGGTGLAYVLNYRLVADEGPTAASTVTYLMPLVSMLLGAVFLGESVGPNLLVGTLVVLAGVFLAQRRTAKPAGGRPARGHRHRLANFRICRPCDATLPTCTPEPSALARPPCS